jgi:transposase
MLVIKNAGCGMTINKINVEELVEQVKSQITAEKDLPTAIKASLDLLLLVVTLFLNRLSINSSNSSKPPSADPNRTRKPKNQISRKPGGQNGHRGTTLQPVTDPDEIKILQIDRRSLPHGQYREIGYESSQCVDPDITRVVTE